MFYSGAAESAFVEDISYVAEREHRMKAFCTRAHTYHPPINLAKSGSTVSWKLPPDRFDFWKVRLFKKAGSTAPTSYADAVANWTEVTLAAPTTDTSVVDAHSGTTSYAIYAVYDELLD